MSITAATTGLLIPPTRQRRDGPLALLCRESARLYSDWCASLADARQGQAAPAYLNPALVEQVVPFPAAHVQTGRLIQALAERLRGLGGYCVQATVTGLRARREIIQGIDLANGARLPAGQVLVCAGVGTAWLLRPLGIDLPIAPEVGQIVQIGQVPHLPSAILLDGDNALVAKSDGRLHITGPGEPEYILARIRDLLGGGEIAQVWHGARPRAAGGLPVQGRVEAYKNLLVAAGHGRNGFLLAPLTAKIIAETRVSAYCLGQLPSCACKASCALLSTVGKIPGR